jgi:thiamine biosynthesis lipoprotein
MGNTAHITVVGAAEDALDFARHRISELEQMWSRFVPTSDISRLNVAGGLPVEVSSETADLIRYMVAGWSATQGMFDPTMLGELIRDGYARSRVSSSMTVLPGGVQWSKELDAAEVDGTTVTLPAGMVLDPGGIGKGRAADIVATELVERGVSGAFVSIGGDIRCIGIGDCDGSWIVDIESPFDGTPMCSVAVSDAGIATSSLTAKILSEISGSDAAAESSSSGRISHIMDPVKRRTVDAGQRSIVQATVIAAECVWAEMFTKPYLVLDDPTRIELAAEHGLSAMVVDRTGAMTSTQNWKRYVL